MCDNVLIEKLTRAPLETFLNRRTMPVISCSQYQRTIDKREQLMTTAFITPHIARNVIRWQEKTGKRKFVGHLEFEVGPLEDLEFQTKRHWTLFEDKLWVRR